MNKNIFIPFASFLALSTLPLHATVKYPYAPYGEGKLDPQPSGWPLTEAERAYVLKPEFPTRKPGSEVSMNLPAMWPVTPTAGYRGTNDKEGDTGWLDIHTKLLDAVQSAKDSTDLLLLGDSITELMGGSVIEGKPFCKPWLDRFGSLKTANAGLSGDRVEGVLWRLEHGLVDGAKPKVIVLMIGVNNAPLVTPCGVPATSVAQGIQLIVQNLRERCPSSELVVVKVLPAFEPDGATYKDIVAINKEVEALKLGSDPHVHVIDLSKGYLNADGSLKAELYSDKHLHLNEAGYEVYASGLKPLVDNLLGNVTPANVPESPADLRSIPKDLENPVISPGAPAPGKAVLQTFPPDEGKEGEKGAPYLLYLPTDWKPGERYPVIVEYLGNSAKIGDLKENECVKGNGYGLTEGKGFLWMVLPYVSKDHKGDEAWWWGDVEATVAYAKEAVPTVCRKWGGDPNRVILTGSSRGAIACNYIGLHDDAVAGLWRGLLPISHYDDAHIPWDMTPDEQKLAPERLKRLGATPQLICGEYSVLPQPWSDKGLLQTIQEKKITSFEDAKKELGLIPITDIEGTRKFVATYAPKAHHITFLDFPWINHGLGSLSDTPARRQIRDWIRKVLNNPSHAPAAVVKDPLAHQ
jgi:lysophospholipase L1-like esterase